MTIHDSHSDVDAKFLELYEKSNDLISDTHAYITTQINNPEMAINLSTIATKLIHEAGRWCEQYASDVIISWDSVRNAVKRHFETPDMITDDIVVFGFRQSGVDCNSFVSSRCNSAIASMKHSLEYMKIYAVKIFDVPDYDDGGYAKDVYVALKNIKSEVESRVYEAHCHNESFEKRS